VWPRAAAVAERLWTPLATIGKAGSIDMAVVESRLESFRCLLHQRGVGAAPVTNLGARYAPQSPGSCYAQRRLQVESV
jgi:hexosaminidase